MTTAEVLLVDFDAEIANTRRTLERIPENDPQWKPHEKSMPIGRLALHTAQLPRFCTQIFSTPELDMAQKKWPDIIFQSTAHLLETLDESAHEAASLVATSSEEHLKQHWRLRFGDKVIIDAPRVVLYRTMFLNHLVHHRAQLGVYLRILGVAVPGLYGPSADEPFA
jgi:uncharacterized damage-inducible protein DinB